ncbi:MAG TPA: efflux RND transporter permease subunit [Bacteroidia bacterium]|nr:efflux RND transporter permease subunit [Bacteroidia bacterium]
MLGKISLFILKQRFALLILLGGVTALMYMQARQIKYSYSGAKLLPEDHPALQEFRNFKSLFGEDGSVMVIGFEGKKIFELNHFDALYDLSNEVKKLSGIQEVISPARCYHILRNDSLGRLELKPLLPEKPTTQQQVDSAMKILHALPFYFGLLLSDSGDVCLMAITFDQDKLNTRNRIDIVTSIKEKADVFSEGHQIPVHYSGLPYIRTAVTKKIVAEMKFFILLAIIITAIILYAFFRNPLAVFFSLVVVCIGVVWSFGTLELFGYKITILTSLIAPLIIVIGIPNCIFLLNKYQHEFSVHRNQGKALVRTIQKIGVTTFFANITTAIGFFVFYFTQSETLMEFGVIAALNVMLTYLISLIFIPIVYSFLPAPKDKHMHHLRRKFLAGLLKRIDHWVHHKRKIIYASIIVLLVISIVGIVQIVTTGYVVDDLPKNDIIYRDLKFFEHNFRGVIPFEITIDTRKEGGAVKIETLSKINRLQKMLSGYEEFSRPVSVLEGIKFSYQGLNDGDKRFYILPNVQEIAKLSGYSSAAKENQKMFRSLIDSTRQITRVSIQMADIGSAEMKKLIGKLQPRIDSVFSPENYTVKITGSSMVFLKSNDYLLKNLKESVLLAVFLIALVMLLLFRSLRMIVISILPGIIAIIITAGIMGFYGIPLKPSTILIFSIAFGIASDGTMYFLTKYRQELKHHSHSISKTVSRCISETGISMIYTAVILFFGFGIFIVSGFGGTQALGMLISITLLFALLSNLLFLPSMLLSLEKRLMTKAFMENPIVEIYDDEEENGGGDSK